MSYSGSLPPYFIRTCNSEAECHASNVNVEISKFSMCSNLRYEQQPKKIHLLNEKKCISFFRSYVVVVAVVDCQSTGGSSILLMTANLFSVFPLVVMVATLPLKQRAVVRFHQREPILEYSAAMSERVGVNPTKSGCREVTW